MVVIVEFYRASNEELALAFRTSSNQLGVNLQANSRH